MIYVNTYGTISTIKTNEHIHHYQKFLTAPLLVPPSFPPPYTPSLQTPTDLLSDTMDLFIATGILYTRNMHTVYIIWGWGLGGLFVLLHIPIVYSFLLQSCAPVHDCTINYPFPFWWTWWSSQFLATTNKTAMNMYV